MTEREVTIERKRVVALPKAAAVDTDLPEGATLAREIVNTQLRAVRDQAKSRGGMVDGDSVKALRDMAAVYELLAGVERKERAADSLGDKLASMSDEELSDLERQLGRKK